MGMDAPSPLVLMPVPLPLGLENAVEKQSRDECVHPHAEERIDGVGVVDDGTSAPGCAILIPRQHEAVEVRSVTLTLISASKTTYTTQGTPGTHIPEELLNTRLPIFYTNAKLGAPQDPRHHRYFVKGTL